MAVTFKGSLPQPNFPYVDGQGKPTLQFAQYVAALDAVVRSLAGDTVGTLTNAANDAAAATAGIAVGQLYRNGSAVMVRIK
jgi:hypothetical protein